MGRKIPGKKHRGVKDPYEQRAVREKSLKGKINAPPSNPDEQEIPKSLENLIHLKKLAKNNNFQPKKKKRVKRKLMETAFYTPKEVRLPGMKKPDKVMPNLTQWPGESDDQFMERVNDATEFIINEVEFEQRFSVRVNRNQQSGEVEGVEKAAPDELELLARKKLKDWKPTRRKEKKKLLDQDGDSFVGSKQKRKMKMNCKRAEQLKEREEKEMQQDHVRFGEVVHQPPQITARPRNAILNSANRPGMKNNLLLQGILGSKPVGKSAGALKNQSMHTKQKMEEQRIKAVEAYRTLKAQRNKERF